jgi:hypothetical protein
MPRHISAGSQHLNAIRYDKVPYRLAIRFPLSLEEQAEGWWFETTESDAAEFVDRNPRKPIDR